MALRPILQQSPDDGIIRPLFVRDGDGVLRPAFADDEAENPCICCTTEPYVPPTPFTCLSSNGTCTGVSTLGLTIAGLPDYDCTITSGTYAGGIHAFWSALDGAYSTLLDWDGFSSGCPAIYQLGDPENGDFGIPFLEYRPLGAFDIDTGDPIVLTYYAYQLGSGIGCGTCFNPEGPATVYNGYYFTMTSTVSMLYAVRQSNGYDSWGGFGYLLNASALENGGYTTPCTLYDDSSYCSGTSPAMDALFLDSWSPPEDWYCRDDPPPWDTATVTLAWS